MRSNKKSSIREPVMGTNVQNVSMASAIATSYRDIKVAKWVTNCHGMRKAID